MSSRRRGSASATPSTRSSSRRNSAAQISMTDDIPPGNPDQDSTKATETAETSKKASQPTKRAQKKLSLNLQTDQDTSETPIKDENNDFTSLDDEVIPDKSQRTSKPTKKTAKNSKKIPKMSPIITHLDTIDTDLPNTDNFDQNDLNYDGDAGESGDDIPDRRKKRTAAKKIQKPTSTTSTTSTAPTAYTPTTTPATNTSATTKPTSKKKATQAQKSQHNTHPHPNTQLNPTTQPDLTTQPNPTPHLTTLLTNSPPPPIKLTKIYRYVSPYPHPTVIQPIAPRMDPIGIAQAVDSRGVDAVNVELFSSVLTTIPLEQHCRFAHSDISFVPMEPVQLSARGLGITIKRKKRKKEPQSLVGPKKSKSALLSTKSTKPTSIRMNTTQKLPLQNDHKPITHSSPHQQRRVQEQESSPRPQWYIDRATSALNRLITMHNPNSPLIRSISQQYQTAMIHRHISQQMQTKTNSEKIDTFSKDQTTIQKNLNQQSQVIDPQFRQQQPAPPRQQLSSEQSRQLTHPINPTHSINPTHPIHPIHPTRTPTPPLATTTPFKPPTDYKTNLTSTSSSLGTGSSLNSGGTGIGTDNSSLTRSDTEFVPPTIEEKDQHNAIRDRVLGLNKTVADPLIITSGASATSLKGNGSKNTNIPNNNRQNMKNDPAKTPILVPNLPNAIPNIINTITTAGSVLGTGRSDSSESTGQGLKKTHRIVQFSEEVTTQNDQNQQNLQDLGPELPRLPQPQPHTQLQPLTQIIGGIKHFQTSPTTLQSTKGVTGTAGATPAVGLAPYSSIGLPGTISGPIGAVGQSSALTGTTMPVGASTGLLSGFTSDSRTMSIGPGLVPAVSRPSIGSIQPISTQIGSMQGLGQLPATGPALTIGSVPTIAPAPTIGPFGQISNPTNSILPPLIGGTYPNRSSSLALTNPVMGQAIGQRVGPQSGLSGGPMGGSMFGSLGGGSMGSSMMGLKTVMGSPITGQSNRTTSLNLGNPNTTNQPSNLTKYQQPQTQNQVQIGPNLSQNLGSNHVQIGPNRTGSFNFMDSIVANTINSSNILKPTPNLLPNLNPGQQPAHTTTTIATSSFPYYHNNSNIATTSFPYHNSSNTTITTSPSSTFPHHQNNNSTSTTYRTYQTNLAGQTSQSRILNPHTNPHTNPQTDSHNYHHDIITDLGNTDLPNPNQNTIPRKITPPSTTATTITTAGQSQHPVHLSALNTNPMSSPIISTVNSSLASHPILTKPIQATNQLPPFYTTNPARHSTLGTIPPNPTNQQLTGHVAQQKQVPGQLTQIPPQHVQNNQLFAFNSNNQGIPTQTPTPTTTKGGITISHPFPSTLLSGTNINQTDIITSGGKITTAILPNITLPSSKSGQNGHNLSQTWPNVDQNGQISVHNQQFLPGNSSGIQSNRLLLHPGSSGQIITGPPTTPIAQNFPKNLGSASTLLPNLPKSSLKTPTTTATPAGTIKATNNNIFSTHIHDKPPITNQKQALLNPKHHENGSPVNDIGKQSINKALLELPLPTTAPNLQTQVIQPHQPVRQWKKVRKQAQTGPLEYWNDEPPKERWLKNRFQNSLSASVSPDVALMRRYFLNMAREKWGPLRINGRERTRGAVGAGQMLPQNQQQQQSHQSQQSRQVQPQQQPQLMSPSGFHHPSRALTQPRALQTPINNDFVPNLPLHKNQSKDQSQGQNHLQSLHKTHTNPKIPLSNSNSNPQTKLGANHDIIAKSSTITKVSNITVQNITNPESQFTRSSSDSSPEDYQFIDFAGARLTSYDPSNPRFPKIAINIPTPSANIPKYKNDHNNNQNLIRIEPKSFFSHVRRPTPGTRVVRSRHNAIGGRKFIYVPQHGRHFRLYSVKLRRVDVPLGGRNPQRSGQDGQNYPQHRLQISQNKGQILSHHPNRPSIRRGDKDNTHIINRFDKKGRQMGGELRKKENFETLRWFDDVETTFGYQFFNDNPLELQPNTINTPPVLILLPSANGVMKGVSLLQDFILRSEYSFQQFLSALSILHPLDHLQNEIKKELIIIKKGKKRGISARRRQNVIKTALELHKKSQKSERRSHKVERSKNAEKTVQTAMSPLGATNNPRGRRNEYGGMDDIDEDIDPSDAQNMNDDDKNDEKHATSNKTSPMTPQTTSISPKETPQTTTVTNKTPQTTPAATPPTTSLPKTAPTSPATSPTTQMVPILKTILKDNTVVMETSPKPPTQTPLEAAAQTSSSIERSEMLKTNQSIQTIGDKSKTKGFGNKPPKLNKPISPKKTSKTSKTSKPPKASKKSIRQNHPISQSPKPSHHHRTHRPTLDNFAPHIIYPTHIPHTCLIDFQHLGNYQRILTHTRTADITNAINLFRRRCNEVVDTGQITKDELVEILKTHLTSNSEESAHYTTFNPATITTSGRIGQEKGQEQKDLNQTRQLFQDILYYFKDSYPSPNMSDMIDSLTHDEKENGKTEDDRKDQSIKNSKNQNLNLRINTYPHSHRLPTRFDPLPPSLTYNTILTHYHHLTTKQDGKLTNDLFFAEDMQVPIFYQNPQDILSNTFLLRSSVQPNAKNLLHLHQFSHYYTHSTQFLLQKQNSFSNDMNEIRDISINFGQFHNYLDLYAKSLNTHKNKLLTDLFLDSVAHANNQSRRVDKYGNPTLTNNQLNQISALIGCQNTLVNNKNDDADGKRIKNNQNIQQKTEKHKQQLLKSFRQLTSPLFPLDYPSLPLPINLYNSYTPQFHQGISLYNADVLSSLIPKSLGDTDIITIHNKGRKIDLIQTENGPKIVNIIQEGNGSEFFKDQKCAKNVQNTRNTKSNQRRTTNTNNKHNNLYNLKNTKNTPNNSSLWAHFHVHISLPTLNSAILLPYHHRTSRNMTPAVRELPRSLKFETYTRGLEAVFARLSHGQPLLHTSSYTIPHYFLTLIPVQLLHPDNTYDVTFERKREGSSSSTLNFDDKTASSLRHSRPAVTVKFTTNNISYILAMLHQETVWNCYIIYSICEFLLLISCLFPSIFSILDLAVLAPFALDSNHRPLQQLLTNASQNKQSGIVFGHKGKKNALDKSQMTQNLQPGTQKTSSKKTKSSTVKQTSNPMGDFATDDFGGYRPLVRPSAMAPATTATTAIITNLPQPLSSPMVSPFDANNQDNNIQNQTDTSEEFQKEFEKQWKNPLDFSQRTKNGRHTNKLSDILDSYTNPYQQLDQLSDTFSSNQFPYFKLEAHYEYDSPVQHYFIQIFQNIKLVLNIFNFLKPRLIIPFEIYMKDFEIRKGKRTSKGGIRDNGNRGKNIEKDGMNTNSMNNTETNNNDVTTDSPAKTKKQPTKIIQIIEPLHQDLHQYTNSSHWPIPTELYWLSIDSALKKLYQILPPYFITPIDRLKNLLKFEIYDPFFSSIYAFLNELDPLLPDYPFKSTSFTLKWLDNMIVDFFRHFSEVLLEILTSLPRTDELYTMILKIYEPLIFSLFTSLRPAFKSYHYIYLECGDVDNMVEFDIDTILFEIIAKIDLFIDITILKFVYLPILTRDLFSTTLPTASLSYVAYAFDVLYGLHNANHHPRHLSPIFYHPQHQKQSQAQREPVLSYILSELMGIKLNNNVSNQSSMMKSVGESVNGIAEATGGFTVDEIPEICEKDMDGNTKMMEIYNKITNVGHFGNKNNRGTRIISDPTKTNDVNNNILSEDSKISSFPHQSQPQTNSKIAHQPNPQTTSTPQFTARVDPRYDILSYSDVKTGTLGLSRIYYPVHRTLLPSLFEGQSTSVLHNPTSLPFSHMSINNITPSSQYHIQYPTLSTYAMDSVPQGVVLNFDQLVEGVTGTNIMTSHPAQHFTLSDRTDSSMGPRQDRFTHQNLDTSDDKGGDCLKIMSDGMSDEIDNQNNAHSKPPRHRSPLDHLDPTLTLGFDQPALTLDLLNHQLNDTFSSKNNSNPTTHPTKDPKNFYKTTIHPLLHKVFEQSQISSIPTPLNVMWNDIMLREAYSDSLLYYRYLNASRYQQFLVRNSSMNYDLILWDIHNLTQRTSLIPMRMMISELWNAVIIDTLQEMIDYYTTVYSYLCLTSHQWSRFSTLISPLIRNADMVRDEVVNGIKGVVCGGIKALHQGQRYQNDLKNVQNDEKIITLRKAPGKITKKTKMGDNATDEDGNGLHDTFNNNKHDPKISKDNKNPQPISPSILDFPTTLAYINTIPPSSHLKRHQPPAMILPPPLDTIQPIDPVVVKPLTSAQLKKHQQQIQQMVDETSKPILAQNDQHNEQLPGSRYNTRNRRSSTAKNTAVAVNKRGGMKKSNKAKDDDKNDDENKDNKSDDDNQDDTSSNLIKDFDVKDPIPTNQKAVSTSQISHNSISQDSIPNLQDNPLFPPHISHFSLETLAENLINSRPSYVFQSTLDNNIFHTSKSRQNLATFYHTLVNIVENSTKYHWYKKYGDRSQYSGDIDYMAKMAGYKDEKTSKHSENDQSPDPNSAFNSSKFRDKPHDWDSAKIQHQFDLLMPHLASYFDFSTKMTYSPTLQSLNSVISPIYRSKNDFYTAFDPLIGARSLAYEQKWYTFEEVPVTSNKADFLEELLKANNNSTDYIDRLVKMSEGRRLKQEIATSGKKKKTKKGLKAENNKLKKPIKRKNEIPSQITTTTTNTTTSKMTTQTQKAKSKTSPGKSIQNRKQNITRTITQKIGQFSSLTLAKNYNNTHTISLRDILTNPDNINQLRYGNPMEMKSVKILNFKKFLYNYNILVSNQSSRALPSAPIKAFSNVNLDVPVAGGRAGKGNVQDIMNINNNGTDPNPQNDQDSTSFSVTKPKKTTKRSSHIPPLPNPPTLPMSNPLPTPSPTRISLESMSNDILSYGQTTKPIGDEMIPIPATDGTNWLTKQHYSSNLFNFETSQTQKYSSGSNNRMRLWLVHYDTCLDSFKGKNIWRDELVKYTKDAVAKHFFDIDFENKKIKNEKDQENYNFSLFLKNNWSNLIYPNRKNIINLKGLSAYHHIKQHYQQQSIGKYPGLYSEGFAMRTIGDITKANFWSNYYKNSQMLNKGSSNKVINSLHFEINKVICRFEGMLIEMVQPPQIPLSKFSLLSQPKVIPLLDNLLTSNRLYLPQLTSLSNIDNFAPGIEFDLNNTQKDINKTDLSCEEDPRLNYFGPLHLNYLLLNLIHHHIPYTRLLFQAMPDGPNATSAVAKNIQQKNEKFQQKYQQYKNFKNNQNLQNGFDNGIYTLPTTTTTTTTTTATGVVNTTTTTDTTAPTSQSSFLKCSTHRSDFPPSSHILPISTSHISLPTAPSPNFPKNETQILNFLRTEQKKYIKNYQKNQENGDLTSLLPFEHDSIPYISAVEQRIRSVNITDTTLKHSIKQINKQSLPLPSSLSKRSQSHLPSSSGLQQLNSQHKPNSQPQPGIPSPPSVLSNINPYDPMYALHQTLTISNTMQLFQLVELRHTLIQIWLLSLVLKHYQFTLYHQDVQSAGPQFIFSSDPLTVVLLDTITIGVYWATEQSEPFGQVPSELQFAYLDDLKVAAHVDGYTLVVGQEGFEDSGSGFGGYTDQNVKNMKSMESGETKISKIPQVPPKQQPRQLKTKIIPPHQTREDMLDALSFTMSNKVSMTLDIEQMIENIGKMAHFSYQAPIYDNYEEHFSTLINGNRDLISEFQIDDDSDGYMSDAEEDVEWDFGWIGNGAKRSKQNLAKSRIKRHTKKKSTPNTTISATDLTILRQFTMFNNTSLTPLNPMIEPSHLLSLLTAVGQQIVHNKYSAMTSYHIRNETRTYLQGGNKVLSPSGLDIGNLAKTNKNVNNDKNPIHSPTTSFPSHSSHGSQLSFHTRPQNNDEKQQQISVLGPDYETIPTYQLSAQEQRGDIYKLSQRLSKIVNDVHNFIDHHPNSLRHYHTFPSDLLSLITTVNNPIESHTTWYDCPICYKEPKFSYMAYITAQQRFLQTFYKYSTATTTMKYYPYQPSFKKQLYPMPIPHIGTNPNITQIDILTALAAPRIGQYQGDKIDHYSLNLYQTPLPAPFHSLHYFPSPGSEERDYQTIADKIVYHAETGESPLKNGKSVLKSKRNSTDQTSSTTSNPTAPNRENSNQTNTSAEKTPSNLSLTTPTSICHSIITLLSRVSFTTHHSNPFQPLEAGVGPESSKSPHPDHPANKIQQTHLFIDPLSYLHQSSLPPSIHNDLSHQQLTGPLQYCTLQPISATNETYQYVPLETILLTVQRELTVMFSHIPQRLDNIHSPFGNQLSEYINTGCGNGICHCIAQKKKKNNNGNINSSRKCRDPLGLGGGIDKYWTPGQQFLNQIFKNYIDDHFLLHHILSTVHTNNINISVEPTSPPSLLRDQSPKSTNTATFSTATPTTTTTTTTTTNDSNTTSIPHIPANPSTLQVSTTIFPQSDAEIKLSYKNTEKLKNLLYSATPLGFNDIVYRQPYVTYLPHSLFNDAGSNPYNQNTMENEQNHSSHQVNFLNGPNGDDNTASVKPCSSTTKHKQKMDDIDGIDGIDDEDPGSNITSTTPTSRAITKTAVTPSETKICRCNPDNTSMNNTTSLTERYQNTDLSERYKDDLGNGTNPQTDTSYLELLESTANMALYTPQTHLYRSELRKRDQKGEKGQRFQDENSNSSYLHQLNTDTANNTLQRNIQTVHEKVWNQKNIVGAQLGEAGTVLDRSILPKQNSQNHSNDSAQFKKVCSKCSLPIAPSLSPRQIRVNPPPPAIPHVHPYVMVYRPTIALKNHLPHSRPKDSSSSSSSAFSGTSMNDNDPNGSISSGPNNGRDNISQFYGTRSYDHEDDTHLTLNNPTSTTTTDFKNSASSFSSSRSSQLSLNPTHDDATIDDDKFIKMTYSHELMTAGSLSAVSVVSGTQWTSTQLENLEDFTRMVIDGVNFPLGSTYQNKKKQ